MMDLVVVKVCKLYSSQPAPPIQTQLKGFVFKIRHCIQLAIFIAEALDVISDHLYWITMSLFRVKQ